MITISILTILINIVVVVFCFLGFVKSFSIEDREAKIIMRCSCVLALFLVGVSSTLMVL